MKKISVFIMLLSVLLCLSGCCIAHRWTEASCTEPSKCLNCGETRGEPLGHDWQSDAGILICPRCGAVDDSEERAALGKSETDLPANANIEVTAAGENAVMTVEVPPAEAAEVPAIPEIEAPAEAVSASEHAADFEKYGIVPNMAYKELYSFTTQTREMSALSTVGELAVTDFGILPADSAHPKRDGYEWRYVVLQATFFDENAHKNGVKVMALCEDYYDLALRGTTQRLDADGYTAYTVISGGEEKECRYKRTGNWSDWYTGESGRREILYSSLWEIEIPSGYDGTVVGLYSSAVDWPKGTYINEVYSPDSFRLFRIS